jgi:hypothetical protein
LVLIHQLNFADGAGGVTEYPFDADTANNEFHGIGTSGTAGATTNDHQFIAGVASAGEPVFITMLRLANPRGPRSLPPTWWMHLHGASTISVSGEDRDQSI